MARSLKTYISTRFCTLKYFKAEEGNKESLKMDIVLDFKPFLSSPRPVSSKLHALLRAFCKN